MTLSANSPTIDFMRAIVDATFRPMISRDFDGLAGAAPGSLICELGDVIILHNPADSEYGEGYSVIGTDDETMASWQVDLQLNRII